MTPFDSQPERVAEAMLRKAGVVYDGLSDQDVAEVEATFTQGRAAEAPGFDAEELKRQIHRLTTVADLIRTNFSSVPEEACALLVEQVRDNIAAFIERLPALVAEQERQRNTILMLRGQLEQARSHTKAQAEDKLLLDVLQEHTDFIRHEPPHSKSHPNEWYLSHATPKWSQPITWEYGTTLRDVARKLQAAIKETK